MVKTPLELKKLISRTCGLTIKNTAAPTVAATMMDDKITSAWLLTVGRWVTPRIAGGGVPFSPVPLGLELGERWYAYGRVGTFCMAGGRALPK